MRAFLSTVHRWAGLTIALALVVTGLTGAVLPFQREPGYGIAPDVWTVEPPSPEAKPLTGLELAHRVESEPGGMVSYIPLVPDRDHAQAIFVSPRPGGPPLGYGEVFVDPYTGAIRAKVRYHDLRDGRVNLSLFGLSTAVMAKAGVIRWLRRAGRRRIAASAPA